MAEHPQGQTVEGKRPRLAIIGLDGATWTVIRPMVERGELPTLGRWMEEGVHGPLRSLKMMCTPRIWASIDTGKVPEKHGIVDFFTATLNNLRSKALWEILADQGWTVGLYHWLNTWPPPSVKGFVLPGWLARSCDTHPPSLSFIKEFELAPGAWRRGRGGIVGQWQFASQALRFGLRWSTLARLAAAAVTERVRWTPSALPEINRLVLQASVDADMVTFLLRRHSPDLLMYYFHKLDVASHYYWRFFQPEHYDDVDPVLLRRYGGAIEEVYRSMDRCLARISRHFGDHTIVCCVSDHGFRPVTTKGVPRIDIKMSALFRQFDLPYRLEGWRFLKRGYVRPREALERDWREEVSALLTSFVLEEHGFALFEVMPDEDKDFLVFRLSPRLGELKRIQDRSALRSLVLKHARGQCRLGDLLRDKGKMCGVHDPEGVIILKGPGVRQGERIRASVMDAAPTLLALLGLPIGQDMDGRVITEAIRPEYLAVHPVSTVETYSDEATAQRIGRATGEREDEVRDRLRGLGYLT